MPTEPASRNATDAVQRVVKVRRDYNTWVANETIEDYALRFTPRNYRKWSELRVANTAFGASAFLVLEAVGATLLVNYGFVNAALAILATGLIIFLAGLPLSEDFMRCPVPEGEHRLDYALSGGEDYELLFTVAKDREEELLRLSKGFSAPVTRIGEITEAGDLLVLDSELRPYDIRKLGFDHFSAP